MRLVYISGGFQTSLCSSSRTPKIFRCQFNQADKGNSIEKYRNLEAPITNAKRQSKALDSLIYPVTKVPSIFQGGAYLPIEQAHETQNHPTSHPSHGHDVGVELRNTASVDKGFVHPGARIGGAPIGERVHSRSDSADGGLLLRGAGCWVGAPGEIVGNCELWRR
ncbi:hypothetical protein BCIN_08g03350 [Botrytis cinerea B05.10]|uniref:Uncharacterized protein n=1 Tax=Botryotinia fuckeliana (strain B05.10) TaxID=332648 RepID=A0A384JQ20_BOTFB|nr:hypothetical protein BCIN_08g03350 [Botrytis cinerea B05.10]ATZ52686.1 hypothetical protein BCIN_08g03350 [Botrytis cinerea B05.10]